MNTKEVLNLLQKYQNYVIVAASIFISLVLLIIVVIPQLILTFQTAHELTQTKNQIQFLNSKAQFLSNIDTNVYNQDINIVGTVLPEEVDIPAAVSQIQNLISESRLQLVSINSVNNTSTSQSNSDGSNSYDIKLELLGDAASLKQFINSLNTAPQIMKLAGLDLTGSRGGLTDSNVTIRIYYLPPVKTTEDIMQPLNSLTQDDVVLLTKLQNNVQSNPFVGSNSTGARGKADPFQ